MVLLLTEVKQKQIQQSAPKTATNYYTLSPSKLHPVMVPAPLCDKHCRTLLAAAPRRHALPTLFSGGSLDALGPPDTGRRNSTCACLRNAKGISISCSQGSPFRFSTESRQLPETKFRPKFRRISLIPNEKRIQIQKTKFR